jgi:AraC family transcriptional regulator, regulatory protein of adaptative response / methylated-DNA-[protein]-cysteine methyltransferase
MRATIERSSSQPISLKELADTAGTTPSRARRLFTQEVGLSPKGYHDAIRARRFREHLRAGDTVSRATYEAGYGSSSRVYEKDPAILGMTPSAYRRGGRGMRIRYTIVDSVLGTLLVAFTERGVCAVSLGGDASAREAELHADFPHAEIERAGDSDHEWVRAVLARVTAGSERDIPLDVAGTAFQWQVWKELQRIPVGRTRSYSEVAKKIGRPTAARAVARACATNPVAIVIPCHRVVREDGSLGGYRWGLDRKIRILDREKGSRA